jgi:hypothetical protein
MRPLTHLNSARWPTLFLLMAAQSRVRACATVAVLREIQSVPVPRRARCSCRPGHARPSHWLPHLHHAVPLSSSATPEPWTPSTRRLQMLPMRLLRTTY